MYSNDLLVGFKKNAKGTYELSEVITNDISGEMQYSNAQEWIAKSFGDYKKVIQFENKETYLEVLSDISSIYSNWLMEMNLSFIPASFANVEEYNVIYFQFN